MRWITWIAALAIWSLSPYGVLAADEPNELPFKLYRGYAIVVRGSVGNLKNLNFLVDTGAIPSVLDQRIARKLHLTGEKQKLSVLTQKLDAERVTAPDVQVGLLHSEALSAIVRDLSFASEALGTHIDGMIGFDFLSLGPFTIDYESKKLVFGAIDPSLDAIPYEAHTGFALVTMKVRNRSLLLLLDTGASDLVLFEGSISDCQECVRSLGVEKWSNMGGDVQVQKVQISDALLGSRIWGAQSAFILPHGGGNPPSGLQGLLGVSSLRARRVAFDPKHRLFAWEQHEMPVELSQARQE
jgi:hypothetical protein